MPIDSPQHRGEHNHEERIPDVTCEHTRTCWSRRRRRRRRIAWKTVLSNGRIGDSDASGSSTGSTERDIRNAIWSYGRILTTLRAASLPLVLRLAQTQSDYRPYVCSTCGATRSVSATWMSWTERLSWISSPISRSLTVSRR